MKLNLIIDENILCVDKLKELDQLSDDINYFYICIDPYHIKDKDKNKKLITTLKTSNKEYIYNTSRAYLKNIKEIKNTDSFKHRFHIIENINQRSLICPQNFSSEKDLHKNWSFPDKLTIDDSTKQKYIGIVNKLKKIYTNQWKNHYQDMEILAHAILLDTNYPYIKTLDEGGKCLFFFDEKKPIITNIKYFITSDTGGFFSLETIPKIEKCFNGFKIIYFDQVFDYFKNSNINPSTP